MQRQQSRHKQHHGCRQQHTDRWYRGKVQELLHEMLPALPLLTEQKSAQVLHCCLDSTDCKPRMEGVLERKRGKRKWRRIKRTFDHWMFMSVVAEPSALAPGISGLDILLNFCYCVFWKLSRNSSFPPRFSFFHVQKQCLQADKLLK